MSTPKPNATPAEMRELAKLNKRLYGTKPEVGVAKPMKPSPINQRNYDRLTTMAQKGPLSQTNQRNLAFATKKLGINRDVSSTLVPPGISPPMATDSMPVGPGAGAMGGGMPPAGPGAMPPMGSMPPMGDTGGGMVGTMGGTGAYDPATGRYDLGTASNLGTAGGGRPPNYGGMTMKKGGKVKKMASGGMTSKTSSASKRGDGIAQRGKTKGRMC
jgi:hypothetical protein